MRGKSLRFESVANLPNAGPQPPKDLLPDRLLGMPVVSAGKEIPFTVDPELP